MQSSSRSVGGARGGSTELAWIAGLYLVIHALWYILPLLTDGDEIGTPQRIVTTVSLGLGLIALSAMWKGMRWGWWMMVVITVLNLLLTIPEVLFLEGVMRVGSIFAIAMQVAIAVLLFRPGVRARN